MTKDFNLNTHINKELIHHKINQELIFRIEKVEKALITQKESLKTDKCVICN